MDIKEKAVNYHHSGFNCAQAVFAACGEYTGIEEKTAIAISGGFGGGLRSGEVCGAISGAVMAISAAFPFTDSADLEAKDKIARLANECVTKAKEKFGNVRCADIKGVNFSCDYYIAEMAEIAEEIIKNNL